MVRVYMYLRRQMAMNWMRVTGGLMSTPPWKIRRDGSRGIHDYHDLFIQKIYHYFYLLGL